MSVPKFKQIDAMIKELLESREFVRKEQDTEIMYSGNGRDFLSFYSRYKNQVTVR